ncbi:MarR family transcriptional regulator [Sporosarcina newyorkensis 2681]|uniref:MarR family transcriptional regulator n=1 Tax=Sporosarcina newyorkensis 2681 TaxID=1027292 RepID=F9DXE2_9BACL|nr:MarR family transcriptional regulator [Sporosarcina newyorkensis]EGQ20854.1 MarR family transcriptional regulator [Sporosarcina newyorkensis 2681]
MERHIHFQDFEKSFWQLSRKMENVWKEIYTKTFPGSQSRIMYLLEQNGPLRMSDLANELHITAGAVTTASNILIKNEYIMRLRNDEDRRVVHLDLTEKGRSKLNELRETGKEMMKLVFKDLSDEELKNMLAAFKQASANIDSMQDPQSQRK